jgi:uncharacterized protein YkwD
MRRLALTILITALVIPVFAAPASAGPGEGSFVSLINSSRASSGLPALSTMGTLSSYSRSHSADMAASGGIYHSSKSTLRSLASGWESYGENVGRGPNDPSAIHAAFMSSSGHRNNILGNYTHLGVGTALDDDGVLYVTVVFMRFPSSATTTTVPTTTTPTTQPPSTTPATSTPTTTVPTASTSPTPEAPVKVAAPTTTTLPPLPPLDPAQVPGLVSPDFGQIRPINVSHWSQARMGWVISR